MKMSTRTPPVRMAIACLVVWLVLVATALVPARADADERANREKFEILLAERIANGHVPSTELDRLVWVDIETRELLVTEAKRRGLDSRRAVRKDLEQAEQATIRRLRDRPDPRHSQQAHVELAREAVLARAVVADYLSRQAISEDEIRREYELLFSSVDATEYRVHHILSSSAAEAAEVMARLHEGTPFAIVARERSVDLGSRDRGGDLGWTGPASFEKPFADAMVALQPGQWSQPVRTNYGWHVILVADTRATRGPTFEQVRNDLARRVQVRRVEQFIAELRAAGVSGAGGSAAPTGAPR